MKHKRWIPILFVVACTVQLAVPIAMMVRAERTHAHGEVYRFRCAPVDPMDPFRGRYVALAFDVERERIPLEEPLKHDDQAFATLTVDADGFARIDKLTRSPNDGETAIRVRILHPHSGTASVDLPFDRYFLNEAIAPGAERAYREAMRERSIDAWAEVRVRGTAATLAQLSIDGVSVEDYVRALDPQ